MNSIGPLFWSTIFPAILTALAPGLLWLLKRLGDWLKAKAAAADASAAESRLWSALGNLDRVAQNVVEHVNVAQKEKLTTYLADGVLTEEEKADLKSSALKTLLEDAPQLVGVLKDELGGAFEAVVSGAIERAVKESNKAKLAKAAQAGADLAAKVTTLEDAAAVLGGAK